MRALVTGAAGFVGRHLVPQLEAARYEVTATDLELDVSDETAVCDRVAGLVPDVIVHLAAIASPPQAARAPELTYRVNFLGTRSVLEAATRHAPEARVLLVCSADAYGSSAPGSPPFNEEAPLRPASPYARSKAAGELLGGAYAARGLDVVSTRSFNHTGPGQSDAFVLSSFAKQAAQIAAGAREPVMRVGNLDSVRDFLAVDDVVRAYVGLCDRAVPANVYNVASGKGVRVGDALDTILRVAGVSPRVELDPARHRPTDHAVGDATRLRSVTGWEPRIPLEETLRAVVEYWRREIAR